MHRPRVLLVSLGGTITMTRDAAAAGIAPTLGAAELVAAVPGLADVADIAAHSMLRIPGASLGFDDLIRLAALLDARFAEGVDGAVVIQGTDTIEETAWFLDLLVAGDAPVVVTGAMRGPQMPGADGPANLLAATIVAASERVRGLGALVVLNDEVHAARFVQKMHTALPSAFASPSAGPIGSVAEGGVHLHARLERTPRVALPPSTDEAPVALLRMALGDDGRMLPALPGLGYRGAVIEAMGAGHVAANVAPLIGDLVDHLPVVLSVRVAAGPAFTKTYGFEGSEIDLLRRGAMPAGWLGGLRSRILLSLLLRSGLSGQALRESFGRYVGR
ncbi:MAG: asparaginase [Burkholderiaceae bacterium]|nr:asparaginase [Burkholderiaceae bacterium]